MNSESDDRNMPAGGSLDTTAALVEGLRAGDEVAREKLIRRCLPVLRSWAHGRLPSGARHLHETDDLVQITLIKALGRLDQFEHRREGAFWAYLRAILLNVLRDEGRRSGRLPLHSPLTESIETESEGVSERVFETYEKALTSLSEVKREAVILRVEFGFSFPEIAHAIELPSADAARMMVKRSLLEVAKVMDAAS